MKKSAPPKKNLPVSAPKIRFRKTKLLALFAAVLATGYFLFPNAFHIARYYAYEGYDYVREQLGFAPQYDNLALGAPEGRPVDRIFNREGYAFGYSEKLEQPLWVTYKLTVDEVKNKVSARTDDFREDPRILTRSASPDDYKNSGFDRGHLAPAADMGWNDTVMSESFYMSNMSPQVPEFNRGIWLELEEQVRSYAVKEKEVVVVTGPIFYPMTDCRTIGKNTVVVPDAFYKVVFALTPPRKMIGFILPNARCTKPLVKYACTVKEVEKATGLVFFPKLVPDEAATLKEFVKLSDWGF